MKGGPLTLAPPLHPALPAGATAPPTVNDATLRLNRT